MSSDAANDYDNGGDMAGLTLTALLWQEIQAVLAGAVGGARYGVKIRAPHALLMTFLFNKELSTQEKLQKIIRLCSQHAGNLAKFAIIYKIILAALKAVSRYVNKLDKNKLYRVLGGTIISTVINGPWPGEAHVLGGNASSEIGLGNPQQSISPAGYPQRMHHAFVAGALAGYHVWGEYNALNFQVLLYLTSRVMVGAYKRFIPLEPHSRFYSLASALVWGAALMLYEDRPAVLHSSMRQSMDEIYRYAFSSGKK